MSAYSPYSIELLFIRTAGAAASTDDSMRVRKNLESGEFEMVYTDSHDNNKQVHKLHSLYRQRVLDHVYLTLKNLTLDEDNFYQLQMNLPAMPPILVSVENLTDLYYRDHLLELVENGLDNLDVLEKVKAPSKVTTEDEYADMPPLISNAEFARRMLTPSMDRFLGTSSACPQRRSARLAQRCDPCSGSCGSRSGPGADVSGTPRHLFFDENY